MSQNDKNLPYRLKYKMAEIQKQRAHKDISYLNMMEGSPKKMTKSQSMQLDKHK